MIKRSQSTHLRRIPSRFINLLKHRLFWILTIVGNGTVFLGGLSLYTFESLHQEYPLGLLDALLWALGMMTTVGYGPWTPVTLGGKLTAGFLMLAGTLFVWSYMAFLVTGLITPELTLLEADVHKVEDKIQQLKSARNDDVH